MRGGGGPLGLREYMKCLQGLVHAVNQQSRWHRYLARYKAVMGKQLLAFAGTHWASQSDTAQHRSDYYTTEVEWLKDEAKIIQPSLAGPS